MEIVKQRSGDVLDVRVSGRLDNHESEPFEEALTEMIREGVLHLRLDLSDVKYLSSAAIGVLMTAYREMGNLQGTFVISAASERVRTVLRLVALESILFATQGAETAPRPSADLPRQIQSDRAVFDCYTLGDRKSEYRLHGRPALMADGVYEAEDASPIAVGRDTFAVGVGALGHAYDECRSLFGEFVGAAGSAAYMPTDGTSTPDYMMSSGELVPEIQALYALVFRGSPASLMRFESSAPGGAVPLSEIVSVCADVAGTPEFGVVMAAEVSGLVCAMLRRSPAQAASSRFEFPAVREWLSFAAEREHARTSSLVVGVVSSSPSEALAPFVRSVGGAFGGHFHAAVTAFRSLPRGRVEIADVLGQAFQPRSVVSVVHLLRDDRPIEGAGESEFQRGACWVFPFAPVVSGGAT